MHKTFLMLFALFGLAGLVAQAHAQANYKIVTGPERGTYIQIGQDLAKWVADPMCSRPKAPPKTCSACVTSRA
jgi:uncharacterized protein